MEVFMTIREVLTVVKDFPDWDKELFIRIDDIIASVVDFEVDEETDGIILVGADAEDEEE